MRILGEGPYTATFGSAPSKSDVQNGSLASFPIYMTAEATNTDDLLFTAQCGVLKVNLKDESHSVEKIEVFDKGSDTGYTLKFTAAESIATAKDFMIALPAGEYTKLKIYDSSNLVATKAMDVEILNNHVVPVKSETLDFLLKGALPGVFTVNADGKKVRFSQGNLYYNPADIGEPFKLEANQYDYRTWYNFPQILNGTNTATSADNVGLFYWAKYPSNGYDWYYDDPDASADDILYTNTYQFDMYGFQDWFVLSGSEFNYLINTRSASTIGEAENARFVRVSLEGMNGLLLFPDTFTWVSGDSNMGPIPEQCNKNDGGYASWRPYTLDQFAKMEAAGAVFLPLLGERKIPTGYKTVVEFGVGEYLASDTSSKHSHALLLFNNYTVEVTSMGRDTARAIRMVTTVE